MRRRFISTIKPLPIQQFLLYPVMTGPHTSADRLQALTRPVLQLASRPLALTACLVLPAWFALDNFVVALAASLLLAFFATMLRTLWLLRRNTK